LEQTGHDVTGSIDAKRSGSAVPPLNVDRRVLLAEVPGRINNLDLPLDFGAVFVLRVERPARASS